MLALTHAKGLWSDSVPRWLVTNGEAIVGPVHTELLLRGYLGGRIPRHCQVRQEAWHDWRPLEGIREIGGVKRALERDASCGPRDLREAFEKLPETNDVGELLSLSLSLAAQTLSASAGLLHRYRSPVSLPVTSAVHGAPPERLGDVLSAHDPAYALALRGRSLCGAPSDGTAERLIAERLQRDSPLRSVTMTPVISSCRLVALLELGRTDHAFRAEDVGDLAHFAARVARRIG